MQKTISWSHTTWYRWFNNIEMNWRVEHWKLVSYAFFSILIYPQLRWLMKFELLSSNISCISFAFYFNFLSIIFTKENLCIGLIIYLANCLRKLSFVVQETLDKLIRVNPNQSDAILQSFLIHKPNKFRPRTHDTCSSSFLVSSQKLSCVLLRLRFTKQNCFQFFKIHLIIDYFCAVISDYT